ncbi:MAG: hypothetical protein KGI71_04910 [Patescibacteria group bacterium]|nr:hypothetical protein [Patescibacteria group bacterium]
MRIRETGGCINRAEAVEAFVLYSDGEGAWMPISKTQARSLLDDAARKGVDDITVEVIGATLRIGEEHSLEDEAAEEAAHPVCSECDEPWGPGHECSE